MNKKNYALIYLFSVQCLCASTLFYCAHWQTYVSGTAKPLFLKKLYFKKKKSRIYFIGTLQFGKIDVTEGQFVVMGVMIVSSVSSFIELDIWNINVSSVTPFAQSKLVAADNGMERLAESRNNFLSCVQDTDP